MGNAVPEVLLTTMRKEYIYNALKKSGYVHGLPPYTEIGNWDPADCANEVAAIPISLQGDIAWCVIEEAHNHWRSQGAVLQHFFDEDCFNYLNVFARLELAGPKVYNIWAYSFQKLFSKAGFTFGSAFDMNGYDAQMSKMEELNFGHSLLLSNAFVANRRRFVEESKIVGKGDLYRYVSETSNDVLGIVYSEPHIGSKRIINQICRQLYYEDTSLPFCLTRQIILANGGDAPIDW